MNTNTQPALTWQAAKHQDHERSREWYMVSGSLCGAMVIYGILSGAWSLSLVFAFIPALYYLIRNDVHKKHTISISETGVSLDSRMHLWAELKEFWILAGPGYHELHIAHIKASRADIVIQTGDIDPYALRDLLSQFLPQVGDRRERLLDAIIRFCKI